MVFLEGLGETTSVGIWKTHRVTQPCKPLTHHCGTGRKVTGGVTDSVTTLFIRTKSNNLNDDK